MKSKTERLIIQIIATLLIVAAAAVGIFFLIKQNQIVKGDFVQPEFDSAAMVADIDALKSIYSFDVINATDTLGIGLLTDITFKDGLYYIDVLSLDTNADNILIKLYNEDGTLLASSGLL